MSSRKSNIQWPWESEGWATDEFRAKRDKELDAVVIGAIGNAPSVYGMRQQRAPVNPYLSLWLVPLIGASSWFLATKLGEEWWGWLVVGLFAAMAVLLLVQCLRAIPGWHRARAAARAYTAARGIPFPKELRWYN